MKKTIVTALILIASSFVAISPAAAITCPTGTYIDFNEPSKCKASPNTVTPSNLTSVKNCTKGTFNTTTQKCDIPGAWVEATTYTSTTEYKVKTCSSGTLANDGKCHTQLDPPVVTATETRFTWYTCPTQYHPNLSGTKCTGVGPAIGTSIDAIVNKTPCSAGFTDLNGVCSQLKTEEISDPTETVDGYYCGNDLQTSSTCNVAGYTSAATTADPSITYSGTCPIYYTFSTTAGTCTAYTFSPETPITGTIYKCLVSTYGITFTAYFNYDASINAPIGVSRSCTLVSSAITQTETGVYLCTTISNLNGVSISFVSENDVSASTTNSFTQCDFIPAEELNFDTTLDTFELNSSYCTNRPTFELYLICLGIEQSV